MSIIKAEDKAGFTGIKALHSVNPQVSLKRTSIICIAL
jgi:hypothetical protein